MKPDTIRTVASAVTVAMAPVLVVLWATGAPFGVCLIPVLVGILAGFVASTQPV